MTYIELPRALEAYFSFAELDANERGRHFSITFSYLDAGRIDRLQWWWHVSPAQERGGEAMLGKLRGEAIQRFSQHIERWLVNGNRRLAGGEPFPHLAAHEDVPVASGELSPSEARQQEVTPGTRFA